MKFIICTFLGPKHSGTSNFTICKFNRKELYCSISVPKYDLTTLKTLKNCLFHFHICFIACTVAMLVIHLLHFLHDLFSYRIILFNRKFINCFQIELFKSFAVIVFILQYINCRNPKYRNVQYCEYSIG